LPTRRGDRYSSLFSAERDIFHLTWQAISFLSTIRQNLMNYVVIFSFGQIITCAKWRESTLMPEAKRKCFVMMPFVPELHSSN
jgi:hypothetical protein